MKVSSVAGFPWPARRVGKQFRNLASDEVRGWREVLRWKLGLGPGEAPARGRDSVFQPDLAAPDFPSILRPAPNRITATWIGQATFLLQMGGRRFLTDPHFGNSCSPLLGLGFRRQSPLGLALAQLPPIDAVLLSHNHYDHLHRQSLRALGRDTPIVCPTGLGKRLARWGFRAVTEMTWGETGDCHGVQLTCLPAQHGSARTPFDRNQSLWCGWLLEHGSGKAVFVGDTGYAPFFAELGRRFGPVDLALIPIGAYRPFWFMHPLHLQPEEAVRVHLDLRARLSLAMHWGTFILADDPLLEPPLLLAEALARHEVSPQAFRLLRFGETVVA